MTSSPDTLTFIPLLNPAAVNMHREQRDSHKQPQHVAFSMEKHSKVFVINDASLGEHPGIILGNLNPPTLFDPLLQEGHTPLLNTPLSHYETPINYTACRLLYMNAHPPLECKPPAPLKQRFIGNPGELWVC